MRRRQATEFPPPPFVLMKVYSFGPSEMCVAGLEINDGYFYLDPLLSHVAMSLVKKHAIGGVQFKRTDIDVTTTLASIKARALRHGATLEAIQLLGVLIPLTKQEEATMAETNKLSRKAADTEGLKAAAKSAPVKGKGAVVAKEAPAKRKGNAEALEKARAARANTGPDNRKITVLKKDHGARAGTKRASLLENMFKHATVQKAVDSGKVTKSDVSWAARAGYISID